MKIVVHPANRDLRIRRNRPLSRPLLDQDSVSALKRWFAAAPVDAADRAFRERMEAEGSMANTLVEALGLKRFGN